VSNTQQISENDHIFNAIEILINWAASLMTTHDAGNNWPRFLTKNCLLRSSNRTVIKM